MALSDAGQCRVESVIVILCATEVICRRGDGTLHALRPCNTSRMLWQWVVPVVDIAGASTLETRALSLEPGSGFDVLSGTVLVRSRN